MPRLEPVTRAILPVRSKSERGICPLLSGARRLSARWPGPQAVHQKVQQAASLHALFWLAGDTEDAKQARCDVLSADVGAEVTRGAAGIEDGRDGVEELGAGVGVGDLAGF